MKYKVTLKGKTYEVEVNQGEAMILDEYEAIAPRSRRRAPAAAARRAARCSRSRSCAAAPWRPGSRWSLPCREPSCG